MRLDPIRCAMIGAAVAFASIILALVMPTAGPLVSQIAMIAHYGWTACFIWVILRTLFLRDMSSLRWLDLLSCGFVGCVMMFTIAGLLFGLGWGRASDFLTLLFGVYWIYVTQQRSIY